MGGPSGVAEMSRTLTLGYGSHLLPSGFTHVPSTCMSAPQPIAYLSLLMASYMRSLQTFLPSASGVASFSSTTSWKLGFHLSDQCMTWRSKLTAKPGATYPQVWIGSLAQLHSRPSCPQVRMLALAPRAYLAVKRMACCGPPTSHAPLRSEPKIPSSCRMERWASGLSLFTMMAQA